MTLFLELTTALLLVFGAVCLTWVVFGRLLLPGVCAARTLVTGTGRGEGLEQTVKGLLWLRRTGLWRGVVIIEDGGLDREGTALARALARRDGVEFDDPEFTQK